MTDPARSNLFTRRDCLRLGAAALGAAATGASVARAIEPIKRVAGPRFKFSLAAYSYRNLLSGKNATLTLDDFIADCAKMNLEGTELTSYYFPEQVTRKYLHHLAQLCFQQGLDVSGTAIRDDLTFPPGEERSREIAHVKTWIEHAAALGAPVIRVFSGNVKKGTTPEQAHRLAVEALEECCEYAGQHGVHLALENHGGLTETVEGMLALVRDVKSPWFGVNVDTGNFRSETAYEDLAKIAPFALNVQIKVVMQLGQGNKQPADYKRLARIVRDAGYRGYIVLEYEEPGDPRTECPLIVDELREAFVV